MLLLFLKNLQSHGREANQIDYNLIFWISTWALEEKHIVVSPGSPTCWFCNMGRLGTFQEGLHAFGSGSRLGGPYCTTRSCQEDQQSRITWDALGVSGQMQGYHLERYHQFRLLAGWMRRWGQESFLARREGRVEKYTTNFLISYEAFRDCSRPAWPLVSESTASATLIPLSLILKGIHSCPPLILSSRLSDGLLKVKATT